MRGLLALYVMLVHFTSRYEELYGHSSTLIVSFAGGMQRVQALFAISGFVIAMTIGRASSPIDFIYGRASRLYPAYWAAIVLTFTITTLAQLPDRTVSLGEALINLSMLEAFFRVPYVDGAYWTLTVELLFYFWMLLLYFTRARSCVIPILALWFVLAVALKGADILLDLRSVRVLGVLFICDWIPFFAIGMLAYRAYEQGRYDATTVMMTLAAIFTAGIRGMPIAAVTAAVIAAGFALMFAGGLTWLRQRPLLLLGSIAYPLYLLHQNIGYVCIRWLEGLGVDASLAVVVAAVAMLALAYLVTVACEQPVVRWLRKIKPRLLSRFSTTRAEPAGVA